jgi:hypothetical protein
MGVPVRVLGVVGVRLPLAVLPRLRRPFDVLRLSLAGVPLEPMLELSRDVDVDRLAPVLVLVLTLALRRRSLGGGRSDARRCGVPPRAEGVGVARAAAVNDEDVVDSVIVDDAVESSFPKLLALELRRLR